MAASYKYRENHWVFLAEGVMEIEDVMIFDSLRFDAENSERVIANICLIAKTPNTSIAYLVK